MIKQVMERSRKMPGTILQINFKFEGSKDEYLNTFQEAAAPIAAAGGLRWKVWPWNEEERVGGGIYLFEDDASAQAFLEGPIAAGLGEMESVSELSVKRFEVLDSLTTVTRGPI
jgi:hypothetical protein